MAKKLLMKGRDSTNLLPVFREMILNSGIKEGENLIWAGCQGTCYGMATFLTFGIRDLNFNLYYAVDADVQKLWKLEYMKDLGIIAVKRENPVMAKVLILMSGLTRVPFQNVSKIIDDVLASDGLIIGETVVPGLFEKEKWSQIPFRYVFEFSMENPSSFEIHRKGGHP